MIHQVQVASRHLQRPATTRGVPIGQDLVAGALRAKGLPENVIVSVRQRRLASVAAPK